MATANEMASQFNLKGDGAMFKERTFNTREISFWLSSAALLWTKRRFDEMKNRTQRGFRFKLRRDELAGLLSATATFRRSNHDFIQGTDYNGAYRTPELDPQSEATNIYGCFAPIPNEALYIVNEVATISKGSRIAPNVEVVDIDPAMYADMLYDPFKNPNYDTIWSMPSGNYTTAYNIYASGDETVSNDPLPYSTKFGDSRVLDGATNDVLTGMKGMSTLVTDPLTFVRFNTERSMHLIPGSGWDIEEYRLHYVRAPKAIVANFREPAQQQHCELPAIYHDEIVDLAVQMAAGAVIPLEQKYQVADKEAREDE